VPRRLEPLHLPLAASSWSMRVLRPIVRVAALAALDLRPKRALRHAVTAWLVGDKEARHVLQPLHWPLEETLCRPGIAATLHQDVEHAPVLIDGTSEIVQFALDPDEDLIRVPFVTRPRPTPAKIICEAGAEPQDHRRMLPYETITPRSARISSTSRKLKLKT
jgi:hypothetical protein